jgi:hypothetical protein
MDLRRLAAALEAGSATDEDRRAAAEALRMLASRVTPKPGQRKPETMARMEAHQGELRAMATRFFPDLSAKAAADAIHRRLKLYHDGADWRRDRAVDRIGYGETLRGACWRALRAYDRVLSTRRIRAILAMSSGVFMANGTLHDHCDQG